MDNRLGSPGKDGIYFTVSTMLVDDNRSIRKPIKDKDGYYTNVPVAVMDTVSRNKTFYYSEDFNQQLKGPSNFNIRLTEGTLKGEYGHPFIANPNSREGIARLLHIESTLVSNHIRSISVKKVADLGLNVVFMDTKGHGPYGKYFEESMDDPTINTAFSLRGLSAVNIDRQTGVMYKKLKSLVTFDSEVVGSGFKQSTKRYISQSMESLNAEKTDDILCETIEHINCQIDQNTIVSAVKTCSVETFSNTEINDIFKSKSVIIANLEVGVIDQNNNCLIDNTGNRQGIFSTFMKVKGR